MKAATKTVTKELVLIAKYTVKRNGATIYRARSNQPNKKGRVEGTDQVEFKGEWYNAYNVTVYKSETVCGCTCKGSEYKGRCYHRDGIQARLDAAKVVVMMPTQPVVEKAYNLNGAQQSAGLLMALPSKRKSA